MPKSVRVWLAFVLLCLIWGSSYLFIRVGLRQLTPLALVALRLLVGVLVIGAIVAIRRQPLGATRRQLALLFGLATVNTSIPFFLISWGEVTVPSGLAAVLNSTVPIFSVLLAGAFLPDEPITLARAGGVLVGFGGVVLLLSRDLSLGDMAGGFVWTNLAGQAAIVLASLCYAVAAVYTRRLLRGVPPLTVATWVLVIAAAQTLLLSLLFSPPPPVGALTMQALVAVLWLGALGSGIAYSLSFFILASWGASRYTLVAYTLPVVGLTLGVLVLQEVIDGRILGGTALVLAGIGLASIVRKQPEREPGKPASTPDL